MVPVPPAGQRPRKIAAKGWETACWPVPRHSIGHDGNFGLRHHDDWLGAKAQLAGAKS